jgi:hypothetical protein
MAAPIIYRSTDTGAPTVVAANPGDLVKVLDACLVNGYGSKPGAGWAITHVGESTPVDYSATSKVYRAPAGNRHYLACLDWGTNIHSTIVGYTSVTGMSGGSPVGTGPVIGASQSIYWRRTIDWLVAADDRSMLYLSIITSPTTGTILCGFGDIYSLLTGDAYHTLLSGLSGSSVDNNTIPSPPLGGGMWFPRGVAQTGSPVRAYPAGYVSAAEHYPNGQSNAWLNPNWPWPNPSDSSLHLARITVGAPYNLPAEGLRGYLRGLWLVPHNYTNFPVTNLRDLVEIEGQGDFAGRSFLMLAGLHPNINSPPVFALETTEWEHN